MLMVSIISFVSPLALLYGFHARRTTVNRWLAWTGLVLALVDMFPYGLLMFSAVMNLKQIICR